MKILLGVHTFFPNSRAGTEVYTLSLARALKEYGHQVQVICYEPNAEASADVRGFDDIYEGLPVHRILFKQRHPDMLLHEYFNPQVEKYLIGFYRRFQPDVVHVIHSMHLSAATITAAQYLGLPVVCTPTDFWYICPTYRLLRVDNSICPGPVNFLQCARCYRPSSLGWRMVLQLGRSDRAARLLRPAVERLVSAPSLSTQPALREVRSVLERPDRLREILSLVDVLVVPNNNTHRVLAQNGITAKRTKVLSFGLSLPPGICAAKKSSRKLRLAFIGTLDYAKGPHVALKALRSLSEQEAVELTVYGDPQVNPRYSLRLKKIARSDRRIKFAGTFPNEKIGEIFSEIDALVIPSLWYENTPLVLYSAFASKTPVIVSNVGSLADVVRHGENGLVFEMGNSDDLARQIQRVLSDRSLLEKLRQGIPPVKPIEQNARELLEIYAALSTHPAVAKPQIEVTPLSKWLESIRRNGSSTVNRLDFFDWAKIRSVFWRRGANFGDKLELCRFQYAFDSARQMDLRFVWRYVQLPKQDLSIVVQFIGKSDAAVFRADHRLREAIEEHGWSAKNLAAYSIAVQLPEELEPGSYGVNLRVWDAFERRFVAPTNIRGWREEQSHSIRMASIRVV